MTGTLYGAYHGPHPLLLGRCALLREVPRLSYTGTYVGRVWLAQFDLPRDADRHRPDPADPRVVPWCYGWHVVRREYFTLFPEHWESEA